MALNPKTSSYRDRASVIYKEHFSIIVVIAAITAIVEYLFGILDANSKGIVNFVVLMANVVVTAPLFICSYHIYIRAIRGEKTETGFVMSWITNPSRIIQGVNIEFKVIVRAIGWYIIYALIVVASAFLGMFSVIGIIAGAIFIAYVLLRYNGAFYECAAHPDEDVGETFRFGVEKLKGCMKEYVNLWLVSALPAVLIITVLETFLAHSWIFNIVNLAGVIILDFYILPRFHIAGIMLYNDGYMTPASQSKENFEI